MATPQFNIRIDSDLKERFLEKAKKEKQSGSDLIVRWIKVYLGDITEDSLPTVKEFVRSEFEELLESRLKDAVRAEVASLAEAQGMGKQAA